MRSHFIWERIRDAVLPVVMPGPFRCRACDRESLLGEDGLCDECRPAVLPFPLLSALPPLDGLSVGVYYTEPIRLAVLRLKTMYDPDAAEFLASFLRIPADWQPDLLVPVPQHPIDAVVKGWSHTKALTRALSAETRIPCNMQLLRKVRLTLPQKKLTAESRAKNQRRAYAAAPQVKGLRIVVIDDLRTTGATLNECARALKLAGAAKVYGCVVASPR